MFKKYKDFIILLVCLIAILQLYLYTMFPAFKSDDSPETITCAYTLGISHTPGYPLFTMMAKAFSLLPIGSPAFRINLFGIFLAMLVLFLSYYNIKRIIYYVFKNENKIIIFFGVFMFAFSYIFWNQAIEAKGGIYILNLLFLAILLYSSIELLKSYNVKNLYLISFIFGLSLTNHWPSMVILLPFFLYIYIKHRRTLNGKEIFNAVGLFMMGLSPYLFLPLRAQANPALCTGNPDTWENFWWVVSRAGYMNMRTIIQPSVHLYEYQIKEFLNLFFGNFSYLWLLIFAGSYAMLKKIKKFFIFIRV